MMMPAFLLHQAPHVSFYHKQLVTDRALSFNDQSIQENFHAWKVFSRMAADPALNLAQEKERRQAEQRPKGKQRISAVSDPSRRFAAQDSDGDEDGKEAPLTLPAREGPSIGTPGPQPPAPPEATLRPRRTSWTAFVG